MEIKTCKWGHAKTPDNVYKHGACKICARERSKKWATDHPGVVAARAAEWYKNNPDRVYERYLRWKAANPGVEQERNKRWRARNPEREKENGKRYYAQNKLKMLKANSEWAKANRRRMNDYSLAYAKRNPHKITAHVRKRQAAKLQRTPHWLTEDQIKTMELFYMAAAALTKDTGVRHEVDHIVPLQGKLVSGLHVPWNMQILTRSQNRSKTNYFTPGVAHA
jgi:5-methylcytosine-specific restriction endonuclease McrA